MISALLQSSQGTIHFPCAGYRQLPLCGLADRNHLALQVVSVRQIFRNPTIFFYGIAYNGASDKAGFEVMDKCSWCTLSAEEKMDTYLELIYSEWMDLKHSLESLERFFRSVLGAELCNWSFEI